jgi:hypothetical protein
MTYSIYIAHPQTRSTLAVLGNDKAYDASAIVNWWSDAGFSVSSDLWDGYDPTAMMHSGVQCAALPAA